MISASSCQAHATGAGSAFATRSRTPGRRLLAVVRRESQGDGVAYVARLSATALHDLDLQGPTIELAPRTASSPTLYEQFRFLAGLTASQARKADWTFFTHLGLARAQRHVPARWRKPYAVFLHGIEVWEPDLSPARRRTLRGATLRLANSYYTARRVESTHPDVGPVQPCPLALHPDDARAAGGAADASMLRRLRERS